ALQLLHPGEAEEIVRQIGQAGTFVGKPSDAFERAPLALALRVLEILGEQLQVQEQRADVVLNVVDEPARQFREFGIWVHGRWSLVISPWSLVTTNDDE